MEFDIGLIGGLRMIVHILKKLSQVFALQMATLADGHPRQSSTSTDHEVGSGGADDTFFYWR